MAVGKNKRVSKGGKRGQKKKVIDAFARKEWYDVVAPTTFSQRQFAKTLTNKSQGNKMASENLIGRVFESCLGDMMQTDQAEYTQRKMKMKVEDVQGRSCITNFYGLSLTTDRLASLIKKRCSMIEAITDVKTSDGYLLRFFCIGFTDRKPGQVRKNCYAQTSQVKKIRAKMVELIGKNVAKTPLQEVVKKLQLENIGKDILKATSGIFPLRDVCIRKVKTLKAPKTELGRLLEIHGDIPVSREEIGAATN